MMTELVQKPRFGIELPAVRRFELSDIAQHAKWLLPRLCRGYPHLNERTALGFLNNILYNQDYYFCYQPHAAGLMQVERAHMLTPEPIVREKFVWVEDAKDEAQIDEALAFYSEFAKWGERFGAKIMIVGENTDVPHEKLRTVFEGKRIFTREQKFVRIDK
jgi:hypothetical protein